MGGEMEGKGKRREIVEIPMCVHCAVACENDIENALLQRVLRHVELADGGPSRSRWLQHSTATDAYDKKSKDASSGHFHDPRATTKMSSAATHRNLLGGDSSMDMASSPPPDDIPRAPPRAPRAPRTSQPSGFVPTPPPSSSCSSSSALIPTPAPIPGGKGRGKQGRNEVQESEHETLAKLHYYRQSGADPSFATLECVVPVESALYVSISGPIDKPSSRPPPAKPLPEWMRLLPGSRNKHKIRNTSAPAC
ncbi:hypothetical protein F5Y08DRAFT_260462 [Xylaria arbuscula]|nr:hypothetical protein F5Y08DRAFT_260462 [Xylaria arbuscula]